MGRGFFTAMVTSLALVLLAPATRDGVFRHHALPRFGPREKLILVLAGVLGGTLSGLIGCGENIVVFMVMVVLFRVNEKVVTPTTVLLMWMITAAGFLLHLAVIRDFPPRVIDYWLAAAPIAVVTAPLGTFLCSRIERQTIVGILVVLIAVELISTLLLVDLSHGVGLIGLATLTLFASLNWAMSRSRPSFSAMLAPFRVVHRTSCRQMMPNDGQLQFTNPTILQSELKAPSSSVGRAARSTTCRTRRWTPVNPRATNENGQFIP